MYSQQQQQQQRKQQQQQQTMEIRTRICLPYYFYYWICWLSATNIFSYQIKVFSQWNKLYKLKETITKLINTYQKTVIWTKRVEAIEWRVLQYLWIF